MENNQRNKTNNNNSNNIFGIIGSSSIGSWSESENKVQGTNCSQRTPIAETQEPFKRALKLGRSPIKNLGVDKPLRARSSPPALGDTRPLEKAMQPRGNCMVELESMINKLIEAMRLPQWSINTNMRNLLGLIAKQHASAHKEHTANKEARQSILVTPMTAETTPKRPREEILSKRRTPLK